MAPKRYHWIYGLYAILALLFFLALLTPINYPKADRESTVSHPSEGEEIKDQLTLPLSLQKIGESAFEGTAAQEAVLLAGIQDIGHRAFANMINLKKVIIPETIVKIDHDVFEHDINLIIFGIQGGKVEKYANENHLKFQSVDVLLPIVKYGTEKAQNYFLHYIALLTLILINCTYLFSRKLCEACLAYRKLRIELHHLDLCFP